VDPVVAVACIGSCALVTDITEALSLALAGIGIAYVVELLARPYLRDGSLKWLLPQAAVEQEGALRSQFQRLLVEVKTIPKTATDSHNA
jgi:DNA-binding transcriptional LysR family regulator